MTPSIDCKISVRYVNKISVNHGDVVLPEVNCVEFQNIIPGTDIVTDLEVIKVLKDCPQN